MKTMKTKKTKILAMTLVACLLVCMGAMFSSFASKETKEEEKPDYDLVALAEAVEKYDEVDGFSDGLAMVVVGEKDEYGDIINGKWGYVDKKGRDTFGAA